MNKKSKQKIYLNTVHLQGTIAFVKIENTELNFQLNISYPCNTTQHELQIFKCVRRTRQILRMSLQKKKCILITQKAK